MFAGNTATRSRMMHHAPILRVAGNNSNHANKTSQTPLIKTNSLGYESHGGIILI